MTEAGAKEMPVWGMLAITALLGAVFTILMKNPAPAAAIMVAVFWPHAKIGHGKARFLRLLAASMVAMILSYPLAIVLSWSAGYAVGFAQGFFGV
jgi:hypothetical protein